jgi:hypothetical protein
MRIDFHKLIKQSGEKLTKADLAREMVAKGYFGIRSQLIRCCNIMNGAKLSQ